jgi:hypothetical protein
LPIVGDLDRDGNPEVAILPWYDVVILDARTGQVKDRCPITEGRSYGFLGAYDLNGDGKSELVIQSDLAKHVDVLGYREGKLSVLWRHAIELDISNPQKIMNIRPNPVGDIDGDGKLEVLVNVYNDLGDGSWHITAYDGITGEIKADLPGHLLNAIVDVDGDGTAEILTTQTTGRVVPAWGTIAVCGYRDGKVRPIWEKSSAAWQTWDPPLPSHVNSTAALANRDVLCRRTGDRTVAAIREPVQCKGVHPAPGHILLSRVVWHQGGFQAEGTLCGPGAQALGIDPDGNLLVRCTTRPGEPVEISVDRCQTRVLGSQTRGVPPATVAVAHPVTLGRPVVVAEGADEQLVAFHAPQGDRPAKMLWHMPGRGQGWIESWNTKSLLGPVVADLGGDGRRQVLCATAAPEGHGRLMAVDLAGQELWHHDFHNIPGTRPVQHFGGILHWQAGHTTNPQTWDVLVTVRRSAAHSEEAVLLSGRDGRELWRRDRQVTELHSRAVGGQPFAIADFNQDGLDEIVSLHPSVVLMMRGSTGESILSRSAVWDEVSAKPVYWGTPIAGDFEGSGETSIFFGTWRGFMGSMTALLRADATLVWWDALDTSPCCLPAIGDVDGDGRLEAVGIGYIDGIRCYDASTGTIKWRLPAPSEWYVPPPAGTRYPVGTASGDIDSNGRDEVLFVVGNTLYCIEVPPGEEVGRLSWKIDLPADAGPPCLADVDGQGQLAILVAGQDGYVYCVR